MYCYHGKVITILCSRIFKKWAFFSAMKTDNSCEHHTKCPYNTFPPPPIPTPSICLFTEWHIDQQKQIMALQELLKKKIYCAILIAVMKMNAESERLKNGSYTFAQCIFHFFVTLLSLFSALRIPCVFIGSH